MDKSGKFHLGTQRAMAADKHPMGKAPAHHTAPMHEGGGKASIAHTTLHDHGDGSYHTEDENGQETGQHANFHAAMNHMAERHGEEPPAGEPSSDWESAPPEEGM